MALSIKTKEADRLARELSRLTGESMTEAVTKSLVERLDRLQSEEKARGKRIERVKAFIKKVSKNYDRRPVTKAEWDAGWE
jgi:antitoxin VapB